MERNIDYKSLVNRHAPPSSVIKNSIKAFVCGGTISLIGELLASIYSTFLEKKDAYLSVSLTRIVIASVLTALGVFDKIARFAGGGTIVPVTGFSNSVTSAAIDTRSEGFILGVGKGIFSVAGPVILFSVLAGTLYGFIYYIFGIFGGML